MRNILYTAVCAISLSAFAQKPVTVDVVSQVMSKDTQITFSVDIPQAELDDVESCWMKYVGEGSKGKAVLIDGIHQQSSAYNGNISPYSFNVHSKLTATSEGVRLNAWFTQNNSAFISNDSSSDSYKAVQKYVRDFAVREYRKAVQYELKAELDKLAERDKELAAMFENEEKSAKKIKENERSNVRSNEAIVTTDSDIRSSSYQIYDQKDMVDKTASDPKASRGAKRTLKNMEGNKRDLQKKNEKQGSNIDARNKENRHEKRSMVNSRKLQKMKTADIDKQRQKVNEVQTKFDNIK